MNIGELTLVGPSPKLQAARGLSYKSYRFILSTKIKFDKDENIYLQI